MSGAGWSRVTHPFATLLTAEAAFSFDLHVLGTPPAFILSQDQTLRSKRGPLRPPSQTKVIPGVEVLSIHPDRRMRDAAHKDKCKR